MLVKIVIAELNRRDYLAALGELRLQAARCTYRAFANTNSDIGLLFAADSGS